MNKFVGTIIMMITFIPLTACYQNEAECTNDSKVMIKHRTSMLEITNTSILEVINIDIIFDLDNMNKGNNKLSYNSDIVIMRDKIFLLADHC